MINHKNKFNAIYHKNDNITCSIKEKLYHNVMLPNGDVSLCCMDYKLENILGNLFTDNYDDIIPVPNTCFNICKFCENGIISSTKD